MARKKAPKVKGGIPRDIKEATRMKAMLSAQQASGGPYVLEVTQRLGKGTFGDVYKVDVQLDTGSQFFAMKMPRNNSGRTLLLEERNIMSILDSPFIMSVAGTAQLPKAWGCSGDGLLMPFCDAGDLLQELGKQHGEELIADFVAQMGLALMETRDKGVIHRDIKAENILRRQKSWFVLGDFGLAARVRDRPSEECGTDGHMAPEVLAKLPYDTAADMWSLGVVAIQLALGHHCTRGAFDRDAISDHALNGTINQVPMPAISQDLRDLLIRMVDKDPAQRPTPLMMLQERCLSTAVSKVMWNHPYMAARYPQLAPEPPSSGSKRRVSDVYDGETETYSDDEEHAGTAGTDDDVQGYVCQRPGRVSSHTMAVIHQIMAPHREAVKRRKLGQVAAPQASPAQHITLSASPPPCVTQSPSPPPCITESPSPPPYVTQSPSPPHYITRPPFSPYYIAQPPLPPQYIAQPALPTHYTWSPAPPSYIPLYPGSPAPPSYIPLYAEYSSGPASQYPSSSD